MMKRKRRKPSFYAKVFTPLILVLAVAVFFLIRILMSDPEEPETTEQAQVQTETQPVTEAPATEPGPEVFPSGCRLCGIGIGGKTPSEALAGLVDAVNAYSLEVRMDGLTFPLSSQALGLHYNTEFDLNDYLEALLNGTQGDFDGIAPVTADRAEVGQALLSAYNSAKEAERAPEKQTKAVPDPSGQEPEKQGQSLVDDAKEREKMLLDPTRAHLVIDPEEAVFKAEDGTEGYHMDYDTAISSILAAAGSLQPAVLTRSEFRFSDGEKAQESPKIADALREANR